MVFPIGARYIVPALECVFFAVVVAGLQTGAFDLASDFFSLASRLLFSPALWF
jgi:hypothetical protein